MKSLFHFCIVALLTIAPTISAFAPGSVTSGNVACNEKFGRYVKVGMGRDNKPAKSQEEDLELTLATIMKHIKSTDGSMADDVHDSDDSQTEEKVDTSTNLGDSTDGGGANTGQPLLEWAKMSKIKSIGTKIKDTIRSKLGKDEWAWPIGDIIRVYLVMWPWNIMVVQSSFIHWEFFGLCVPSQNEMTNPVSHHSVGDLTTIFWWESEQIIWS